MTLTGTKRVIVASVVASVVSVFGGVAQAQQSPREAFPDLFEHLLRLAQAEESFMGSSFPRTYSASLTDLDYELSPNVSIQLAADSAGFFAVVTRVDDGARCQLWYGLLGPDFVVPQNRIGESVPGAVTCAGSEPLPLPDPLTQWVQDLRTWTYYRGRSAGRAVAGSLAANSLLAAARSAVSSTPSDSVRVWLRTALSDDPLWATADAYERLLAPAPERFPSGPVQAAIAALDESDRALRRVQADLTAELTAIRALASFQRYSSGDRQFSGVTAEQLRNDRELIERIEIIAARWLGWVVAWRAWERVSLDVTDLLFTTTR